MNAPARFIVSFVNEVFNVAPDTVPVALGSIIDPLGFPALSVSILTTKLSAGVPVCFSESFMSVSDILFPNNTIDLLVFAALSQISSSVVASTKVDSELFVTKSQSNNASPAMYLSFVDLTSALAVGSSIVGAAHGQLLLRNRFIEAGSRSTCCSTQLPSKYDIEFFLPNLFIVGLTSTAFAQSPPVTSRRGT